MFYNDRFDHLNEANIITGVYGDVNGDNIRDFVYLTGIRTPNSGYIKDITLVIRDGRTGIKQRARLKSDSGYSSSFLIMKNIMKDTVIKLSMPITIR
ncbi:MAG: hypothetical protein K0R50_1997 [Eubacterium sp.]|nr:hypothetical protein [Eubacterium sp.]